MIINYLKSLGLTILIIFAGKHISNLQKEVNTLNKCCDAERKKYSTYNLEHSCLTVRELVDKANFRYGALFIHDSFVCFSLIVVWHESPSSLY